MNERSSYEELLHRNQHSYNQYIAPADDYLRPVVALIAFVIFASVAYPLFSEPGNFLHGLHDMAARASFGLIRRPMVGFGSDGGSALGSVFGLKSAAQSLGTETIQRGLGGIRSIVKGPSTSSDAPAGLGNWDNSCYSTLR